MTVTSERPPVGSDCVAPFRVACIGPATQLFPRPNCEYWHPCGGDGASGLFNFFTMALAQAAAPSASVLLPALYCGGGAVLCGGGPGNVLRSGVIHIGESGECTFLCDWATSVAISAKFCAVPAPPLYKPLD